MTVRQVSHVRHELFIVRDIAIAIGSLLQRGGANADAHSLVQRTTEKLDQIIEYVDGQRTEVGAPQRVAEATQPPTGKVWDAVLVDDDTLVQSSWELQAKQKAKEVAVYGSAEELLANAKILDRKTPIYIDFKLEKSKMQAPALVEELYRLGFRELYLSTGSDREDLPVLDKIKQIRGKNPPWIT